MPKVTYQGAKGGATESMSDAARKETVGERTGKAGYGDFTKASLGAVAPLGAADQAVLKYGQTRPALGVIERVPGAVSYTHLDVYKRQGRIRATVA